MALLYDSSLVTARVGKSSELSDFFTTLAGRIDGCLVIICLFKASAIPSYSKDGLL